MPFGTTSLFRWSLQIRTHGSSYHRYGFVSSRDKHLLSVEDFLQTKRVQTVLNYGNVYGQMCTHQFKDVKQPILTFRHFQLYAIQFPVEQLMVDSKILTRVTRELSQIAQSARCPCALNVLQKGCLVDLSQEYQHHETPLDEEEVRNT